MRRVLIVGGEAVGKTSLGRRLGSIVGVTPVDLDTIAWQFPGAPERPLDGVFDPDVQTRERLAQRSLPDRVARVEALANELTWIAEGFFIGWTEPLFATADVVVWLDHLSFTTIVRRVIARHARSVARGPERPHPGLAERVALVLKAVRSTVAVMRRIVHYRVRGASASDPETYASITRAAVAGAMARHADRVVHIMKPAQLETWLEEFAREASAPRPEGDAG